MKDGVLIETLWNVNCDDWGGWVYASYRINRNIVECKYNLKIAICCEADVLIETLWNVNISTNAGLKVLSCVLIETLWNVNDIFPVMLLQFPRINRNIVECKYTTCKTSR